MTSAYFMFLDSAFTKKIVISGVLPGVRELLVGNIGLSLAVAKWWRERAIRKQK